MKRGFEDALGKSLLAGIFFVLAVVQIASILDLLHASAAIEDKGIVIIAKGFTLIFLLMTVILTIIRLPARNSAAGVEPRVTAIAGTFVLMVLAIVPSSPTGSMLRLLATTLIVTGTILSIFCLWWLGRSFSVMATARRLVVHGPYAFVRHPLYVAEAVTTAGIVLSNWSVAAVMIGLAWCIFQYRRSVNEETILRAAFPEYDEYARIVPRFVPVLTLARKKNIERPAATT